VVQRGHGDYYAGSKYLSKKFSIRPFNWRVGIIKGALVKGACKSESEDPKKPSTPDAGADSGDDEGGATKRVAWDRSSGGYTPLEYFVRMTQGEYYAYPDVSYAQGWALIYFLREIVPQNKKYNEKWGKILDTYFTTLKAEANKDKPLTPKKAPKPDDPGMGDGVPGKGPTTPTPPAPPPVPSPTPGPGAPGATPPPDGEPGRGEPGLTTPSPARSPAAEGFIPPPPRFRGGGGAAEEGGRGGVQGRRLRRARDRLARDDEEDRLRQVAARPHPPWVPAPPRAPRGAGAGSGRATVRGSAGLRSRTWKYVTVASQRPNCQVGSVREGAGAAGPALPVHALEPVREVVTVLVRGGRTPRRSRSPTDRWMPRPGEARPSGETRSGRAGTRRTGAPDARRGRSSRFPPVHVGVLMEVVVPAGELVHVRRPPVASAR
jgi:hypothetical protein